MRGTGEMRQMEAPRRRPCSLNGKGGTVDDRFLLPFSERSPSTLPLLVVGSDIDPLPQSPFFVALL